MSGVLLWAVQGAARLIAQGRLGTAPATCIQRLQQAADAGNWVSKFEFSTGDNPTKPPKMKVKEIRDYIADNFGAQIASREVLKNPDIVEALKALGCWGKSISRVDHVIAVRIKGDQAEQHENLFVEE
jgi:hypothetical protein